MRCGHGGLIAAVSALIMGCTADGPARTEGWSLAGARIAYLSGAPSEVVVLTVGDTMPVNLTRHPAADGFPAWSPDGRRIAFDSDRGEEGNRDIYVMEADGSRVVRLTTHPNYDMIPAWSPDGRWVAFTSLRDSRFDPALKNMDEFKGELYVVKADGSGLRRLTHTPDTHEKSVEWYPDGRRLVFTRVIDGKGQLFSIAIDGSDERRLTDDPYFDDAPSVSPDGRRIAFHSLRGGRQDIWIMNADGTEAENLTPGPDEEYGPAWSPDGAWICYTSPRDGDLDIYAMPADQPGAAEIRLTRTVGLDMGCAWEP